MLYRVIDKQDGVRLLWSLLKSPNPEVLNDMIDDTETSCFKYYLQCRYNLVQLGPSVLVLKT